MYKHIVFDIDGTMLDSAYADLMGLQRVIRELQNRECEISELHFALGIPGEVALKQIGMEDSGTAALLWNTYMKELAYTMRLFDGIPELIAGLKERRVQLGIITSKNKTEYKDDFVPFGLSSYFDTVICVEDCIAPKPSPEPMYAYLKATGAVPQEVLYVGDTFYDSECAGSAGVDFGLALWGCRSVQCINASCSLKTPGDIYSLI